MNDEMFRQSLIEITDNDLLNDFMNNVFGYNLSKDEYVYIQYKIVNGDIFLNIFDNNNDNRFNAICFTNNSSLKSKQIDYIDINKSYNDYKNGMINNNTVLIGALLKTSNDNEKRELINALFDSKMKNIFIKHFL